MAKNQNTRLRPAQIAADKARAANLKTIAGYAPANQAYTVDKVTAAEAKMEAARAKEVQAIAAADVARDEAAESEWELHNLTQGATDQVVAQFGRDSVEAQTMGLTRTSERKSPKGKDKGETK